MQQPACASLYSDNEPYLCYVLDGTVLAVLVVFVSTTVTLHIPVRESKVSPNIKSTRRGEPRSCRSFNPRTTKGQLTALYCLKLCNTQLHPTPK